MAINQNHPFEDIDGVKCAIVEKNASAERVAFVKSLLEHNGFTVMTSATVLKPAAAAEGEPVALPPQTFTIGVTDVTFNVINAIFGRLLKSFDGTVVTMDFWKQKTNKSDDTIPYFQK
jgi:hypothetical protein